MTTPRDALYTARGYLLALLRKTPYRDAQLAGVIRAINRALLSERHKGASA